MSQINYLYMLYVFTGSVTEDASNEYTQHMPHIFMERDKKKEKKICVVQATP